jgi:hypothetical protein
MKILNSVLMSAAITSSSVGFAADKKDNPFGLVYGGAITENVKGQVNIHPVRYKLNGLDIVANVYTPANYDPSKKISCGCGGASEWRYQGVGRRLICPTPG